MAVKSTSSDQLSKDVDIVILGLQELRGLFPLMVSLTLEERMALPILGKKESDFTERAIAYAKEHEEMAPPSMDINECQRDLQLLKMIEPVLEPIELIALILRDTYRKLAAEGYASALDFYDAVERAVKSGVPGSEDIAEDLGELYKESSPKTKGGK